MQSFFERRGPRLDTTLPSVRHVQELIRIRTPVNVVLLGEGLYQLMPVNTFASPAMSAGV
jgi:hypothetical protein